MKRPSVALMLCLIAVLSSCPVAQAKTGNYKLSINDTGTALEVSAGDLFAHASRISPGSTVKSTLTVANHSSLPFEVFFKTDPNEKGQSTSARNVKLLKRITLRISSTSTGKTLYKGPLIKNGSSLSKSLGVFSANQAKRLAIELKAPASLKNDYTEAVNAVKWRFTAQEEYSTGDALPQTGASLMPVAVFAVVSLTGSCIAALVDKRRNRKRSRGGRNVF